MFRLTLRRHIKKANTVTSEIAFTCSWRVPLHAEVTKTDFCVRKDAYSTAYRCAKPVSATNVTTSPRL
ncbi:hypothetical protein CKAH01_04380 [Colletotrichum kahawae]|uniref:Uncharacterized protein n=1 Tax=Colletotrichum kahawae TaxID=34407 RepID=A0AAD9YN50_COLKA|nr:hypothetical protein CKAH01_04380 [Colletotrichum kahawae]